MTLLLAILGREFTSTATCGISLTLAWCPTGHYRGLCVKGCDFHFKQYVQFVHS